MRGSDNCLFCFVLFCFFFLDAVVTVDVLTAKKKKKELVEAPTVHFARVKSLYRFDE